MRVATCVFTVSGPTSLPSWTPNVYDRQTPEAHSTWKNILNQHWKNATDFRFKNLSRILNGSDQHCVNLCVSLKCFVL